MLRTLLARYTGQEPSRIEFRYNHWGKPFLHPESGVDYLQFNLSHSHGIVLYALARGRKVGIDVEYVRQDLPLEDLARELFSPRQMADFLVLQPDMQPGVFHACWTRKEAYLKARGEGLSLSLAHFDVPLVGEGQAGAFEIEDQHGPTGWIVQDLAPDPGYVAAVAAEGKGWRVRYRQWEKGDAATERTALPDLSEG